ncbi:efflux transporter outer membrane subunit [Sphingomonas sp. DT-204]|uniref:efflux transporter outer membrane subunit n=1 Tax=Sphingomonas sp. DT-204 TaxID=3396166 RepID=UPI003F1C3257
MRRAIGIPALTALLLAGCASVPHDPPQVAKVEAGTLGLDSGTAAIDAEWWTAFGDPQLDRLVATGLSGNPSLESALARVRAAEAAVAARRADDLPQVTVDGQTQLQRFSENYIIPPPYGGSTRWVSTVQANLNWNLDLFGRQRAMVVQARASADASRLDAAAARLTIATSIAETYVGLARAERLIQVADGFVTTRQQALRYVQSRIRNQLASQFELRQAETLLAEAEQARTRAQAQRELLVHALAALAGRGADFYPQITTPTLALDTPPAVPDVLPADLLGRRPDVLAGQARIDAAAAGRQVARTDFLPNVSITALAGIAALGLGNAVDFGSRTYGAGPAIHLPIFEGGKLKAQYRGATADLDAAVASYNGAVVGAVREAADAVTQVRSADQDLADQRRVLTGLRETARLDQVRVSTGLGSRLDAIESGFRLLEAEQALVGLQADALTRRIQLIAALGGGFDPNRPLAAAPASDKHS